MAEAGGHNPTTGPEWLEDSALECLARNRCPDCGAGRNGYPFIDGPRGGLSRNIACQWCGSEFNVTGRSGRIIWAHRNSTQGRPDRQRLSEVFGIILP
jgi:hypothetical protein